VSDLTWTEVAQRLAAEPFWWIATGSVSGGPHSVPVWGVVLDGVPLSYADSNARRVQDCASDPRAVLHLPSATDVLVVWGTLRDEGLAEQRPDVVAAYAAKYTDPGDQRWLPGTPAMAGVRLLSVTPRRARAWTLADFIGSQRRWTASSPRADR
jgi:hypothetical protein